MTISVSALPGPGAGTRTPGALAPAMGAGPAGRAGRGDRDDLTGRREPGPGPVVFLILP